MGHERTQGICQSVWRPTAYLLFKREWILMSIGPGASCVVQAAMAGAKACPEPSAKPHGPTRRCRRRGQAPIASRAGATVNRRGVQVIDVLLQRALGGELAVFCVELRRGGQPGKCNMHMQHAHATCTCNMHMHMHVACARTPLHATCMACARVCTARARRVQAVCTPCAPRVQGVCAPCACYVLSCKAVRASSIESCVSCSRLDIC